MISSSSPRILSFSEIARFRGTAAAAFLRELQPYFALFPDSMLQTQVEIWYDRCAHLRRKETEIAALIFCLADGLKTLLLRADGEVFLLVLRSALEDTGYQQQLSSFLGRMPEELGSRFSSVPLFDTRTPLALRQLFAQKGEPSPTAQAWDEFGTLTEWYRRPNASAYALDIRIFAVMRALRQVFCDLTLQIVLIERKEPDSPRGALTRFYVYHTREVIPERPPIYACCTTSSQLRALEEARGSHECKVDSADSFVARATQEIGTFPLDYPAHVFLFETEDRLLSTLLEISGASAGAEDVALARRAIDAAIDPTDNRAVDLLIQCAVMATPRQVRDFNRLLFVFSHGLASAEGPVGPADKAWTSCLEILRDSVSPLRSGSLPLSARIQLSKLLGAFKTNGKRENFDCAAFERAIAEFKAEIECVRANRRPLPNARASIPA